MDMVNKFTDFGENMKVSAPLDAPVSPPTDFDRLNNGLNGKLWAVTDDCYFACEKSVKALPAGYYTIGTSDQNIFFRKQTLCTDNLLELPDSSSANALAEIEKFWTMEEHYREYGFLWKRGFLFWGPPGSGKTSTIQIVIQNIIKRDGIAVQVYNPAASAVGFKVLRNIEPKRPLVAIIEDIDSIQVSDSNLLSLLDGEHQVDNIVVIATTNYPERLDPRIINRPSRFDTVYKIGMPSLEARHEFLRIKTKLSPDNLNKWAIDTENMSIAHIKELIISVEVFKADYNATLDRLRKMAECNLNSDEFKNPVLKGFAPPVGRPVGKQV